jgi:hypothetical protein
MSIVSMCKISEEIRKTFMQKNGVGIICDLMNCKDEDILLNNLRLIMVTIDKIPSDDH